MSPLVSVLIPCHNNEAFVGEAIESALGQTYPNIEVIVVDDGSTDKSLNVIKSYGEQIKWKSTPNRGACAARNTAFGLSQGEFIQFLDADDLIAADKIEKQIPYLIQGAAEIVLCYGLIFGDGKPLRKKKRPFLDPNGVDPFVFSCNQGFSTHGPLHKRQNLEKVGGFNESVKRGQENDLHLRLTCSGARLKLVKEHLHITRNSPNPNRITRQNMHPGCYLQSLYNLGNELIDNSIYNFNTERRKAFRRMFFNQWLNLLKKMHYLDAMKTSLLFAKLY
jgi:glycosyltransferase involved in cell wall biosynthesis